MQYNALFNLQSGAQKMPKVTLPYIPDHDNFKAK